MAKSVYAHDLKKLIQLAIKSCDRLSNCFESEKDIAEHIVINSIYITVSLSKNIRYQGALSALQEILSQYAGDNLTVVRQNVDDTQINEIIIQNNYDVRPSTLLDF